MLRTFREFLQWREGDSIILAEANVLPDTDMEYFGDDGDRMGQIERGKSGGYGERQNGVRVPALVILKSVALTAEHHSNRPDRRAALEAWTPGPRGAPPRPCPGKPAAGLGEHGN